MRIVVDIGDAQVRALDQMAKKRRVARAALIRQAIDDALKVQAPSDAGDAFGSWGNRPVDGIAYQENLRCDW